MNHHCAKFHTNIPTNMDSRNIFAIFRDFCTEFVLFYQKIAILGPILLWIMAKIVS